MRPTPRRASERHPRRSSIPRSTQPHGPDVSKGRRSPLSLRSQIEESFAWYRPRFSRPFDRVNDRHSNCPLSLGEASTSALKIVPRLPESDPSSCSNHCTQTSKSVMFASTARCVHFNKRALFQHLDSAATSRRNPCLGRNCVEKGYWPAILRRDVYTRDAKPTRRISRP